MPQLPYKYSNLVLVKEEDRKRSFCLAKQAGSAVAVAKRSSSVEYIYLKHFTSYIPQ